MAGLVWRLEWRIALARRRLFVVNVVVPLMLVLPIALAGAPAVHAAGVYVVLFVLHGTFGAAIPLVRDGQAGLVLRASRAGVGARALLLERAAAGTCLDFVQLTPSIVVVAWAAGASPGPLLAVAVALLGGLWVANLLGILVAAAARSLAEAALFAAVSTLLLLHVSGVFRTGAPGTLAGSLEAFAPFRALHESLLALLTPHTAVGIGSMLAWTIILPGLLAAAGEPLILLLRDGDSSR